jgi:hypothetical protein
VKLLFTMFPYKFQSEIDSSYEMLMFVEVITTEPDKSVGKCSVALLCLWVARSKYKYLQTTLILRPLRMKEPQRRAEHSRPFTFCGDREGLEFSFMKSYVFYCMSLRQVDKFSFCLQDHVVGGRFSNVSGTTVLIELNIN